VNEEVSSVTRRLSAYIAGAIKKPLPKDVAETGKHHLLDTLAAIVSGSRLLPGRMAIAYVRDLGGAKQALVVGTRIITSTVNAALANGMMAHADETDDSHAPALCHPGCGVIPAALAMAEHKRRSGNELLRAVVLGYDVCARVNFALGPQRLREDGHSSHSFGPLFGAAAAAGALAGLDPDEGRYLLSYTAQQAAGVDCWARDREHVEKAFDFGGMPARNGIAAATMAAAGFTAVDDILSGERNFLFAFSREPAPEKLVEALGERYEVVNTNIKRWAVGSPIQAALDSLSALITEHQLRPNDVEKVTVTIHKTGAATVNDRSMPDINLQHLMALMLLDGTVTFAAAHDTERMKDRRILSLKRRIGLIGDAELEHAPTRQAIVVITTRDGRELKHHTLAVRGTAANPMTRAEVEDKCYDLMAPVLGSRRARGLIDRVWEIEKVSDTRALRPLLQA
jgi:2-methylcitrate dehydratase PrpD